MKLLPAYIVKAFYVHMSTLCFKDEILVVEFIH